MHQGDFRLQGIVFQLIDVLLLEAFTQKVNGSFVTGCSVCVHVCMCVRVFFCVCYNVSGEEMLQKHRI